jgi:polyhydroxybutyrate depolymerase
MSKRNRRVPLCSIFVGLLAACAAASPEPTGLPPTATQPEPTETPPAAAPRYEQPGTYLDELSVAGQPRSFTLHLPTGYRADQPLPLVFDLHGAGSNALQQEQVSHWHEKADEAGLIVVSPQALGTPPVWMGVFLDSQGDPDMLFLGGLLAYLQSTLNIDPNRIYATGLSNGGTMVNRLGCELSDSFAAIAPVSGAHSGIQLCANQLPVSVLAIHGTDDRVIPYEGNGSDVPSVRTWVSAWADRDGCAAESQTTRPYAEVSLEVWGGCSGMAEVALLTVEGGGHGWLGLEYEWNGTTFVPMVGATDVIWDFFAAHARETAP